ncbi:MAG: four helix bundle protein [Candidatus Marinimicrobia bacterium]|nr:four helix bundle protein [Candidatus Neomarinimicrobiota bacterium]
MKEETKELLDRTFQFGVNCLLFISSLPHSDKYRVPKHQLAKSSTSIGSNYEEAQAAESKKDFIHKIGIVSKESRESHYWLRVIKAITNGAVDSNRLESLLSEAAEFKKIFISIKLTAQQNKN